LYTIWNKLDKAGTYWDQIFEILLNRITRDFPQLSEHGKAAFWDANKSNFEIFNTYAIKATQEGSDRVVGQMYDYQLQTKSILLSTSTKERRRIMNSGDSTMIDTYRRYVDLKEDLAKYYGYSKEQLQEEKVAVSELENQAVRLEKVLSLDAEGLSNEEEARTIRWKSIQRQLKEGEAAVELVRFRHFDGRLTDSVLYAAIVLTPKTKSKPKLVVLPNGNELEGKHIKAYKSSIKFKLRDQKSYAQFWEVIDNELSEAKRVYISPDGVFNQLNIATLLKPDGRYIGDIYDIRLLSSTRDILLIDRERKRNVAGTAYLFGYPTYDLAHSEIEELLIERGISRSRQVERALDLSRFGFSELPGTKSETEEITKILEEKKWEANLFLAGKALEEELKSISSPSVLHIATHGFFLDDVKEDNSRELGVRTDVSRKNPLLRSGLLLTGAAQTARGENNPSIENGIFTAYEAMNLDLNNTELVILSACETGRGEIKNGEGVYGLQRAFQIAGAEAIVMSLWKVDDSATQLLMTSFYKHWLNGNSKSEALRLAQNHVKTEYPHPYYWGAFVLIGN
jgi:CHAT domain-containing protein